MSSTQLTPRSSRYGIFSINPANVPFLERYMQSFREELCQFIDAIENDKPVPVNIDDGLRPIRIAIAAKKSSLENRPVRLSEIE